jgi:endonuclease G
VWCGSVVKSGHTIGPDEVAVPDYCWKILFIKHKRDTLAYVFPNTETVSGSLTKFRVNADSVERLGGLKFTTGR